MHFKLNDKKQRQNLYSFVDIFTKNITKDNKINIDVISNN